MPPPHLTYNVYCVRCNGQLGGICWALDPTKLPLYKTISDLVNDGELWANGKEHYPYPAIPF